MKTKNESLHMAHTRGVARVCARSPLTQPMQRRSARDKERAHTWGTFAASTLDSFQTTPESYHSQLLSLNPLEF